MLDTNPSKQSPESTQPNAEYDLLDPVTNYSQHYFLCEFVELATNVSEGITSCLEVIEKADSTSTDSATNPTTAFCASHAEKFQKLAIASARLLGEYAIKHIAWINGDGPPPGQVMKEAENKRPK